MNATTIFDALAKLPDDFMVDDRDDTPPQDREALCGNANSLLHQGLRTENKATNSD